MALSGILRSANFYPRPPRGGRRAHRYDLPNSWIFLSTPSARRATQARCDFFQIHRISIHALREEGDTFGRDDHTKLTEFLSTPSARRAT